jgi:hypothetical protein
LRGCEFELVAYRKTWGEHCVYFYDKEGELKRLPATWTDVLAPDPFVAVAAGRSSIRIADMLRLAGLLRELVGDRA